MLVSPQEINDQLHSDEEKIQRLLSFKEEAPAEYQENTDHFSNRTTLFPYSYHKALMKKHLPNNSSVLDWGAYLGQVTYLLQDEYDVQAYNPLHDKLVTYWNEKFGIEKAEFTEGLMERTLPFEDQTFDAAVSSGVLEHTFEFGISDVDALNNLYRILKDDGLLFIWHLPIKGALSERVARRKKAWKHIVEYELDEILVKLNLTGFDIVAIERNDLIFSKLRKLLPFLNITTVWKIDYFLAHLPFLKKYAHHFTIVAKKVPDFPKNPASSGYTTYA